jgi:hypothetical protein
VSFTLFLIVIANHIEVVCSTIAKLGSHSHDLRTEFKGEIGFVLEADTHVKGSVFDVMVNPIYDLAIDLRVSIAKSLVLIPDPLI